MTEKQASNSTGAVITGTLFAENNIRKVLETLSKIYPKYETKDDLSDKTGIDKDDIFRIVFYLKEKGLVDIISFMGGAFLARITSLGIDYLERKETEKEKKEG